MKPKIGIVANQRFFLTDKIDFWMSYTSKGDVEGIRDAGGLAFIISIDDEEIELRDLDEEEDLQPADSLNILPIADTEAPVGTID